MKYRYSEKQSAVRKRIKNLPRIFERSMRAVYKRDAVELAQTFETAIKGNELRLEKLKPGTIKRKRSQGMTRPSTPLFGKGPYSEMMTVTLRGKKWVVAPARRKHHSGLTLQDILDVHEYGKTIVKKDGTVIKIPARPARSRAYALYLRRRKKQDTNRQVWQAINEMIADGKTRFEEGRE